MKNPLIQLIKESNVIVISGGLGTGKSLLMGLIAQRNFFPGEIFVDWPIHKWLPVVSNIFLDNLDYNETIKEKREELIRDLQIARHLQQRFFLIISEDSFLLPEISHIKDLHIKVNRCNCNDGWKFICTKLSIWTKHLHLTISLQGISIEKTIHLNKETFSTYASYLQTSNRKLRESLKESNQRMEQLNQ